MMILLSIWSEYTANRFSMVGSNSEYFNQIESYSIEDFRHVSTDIETSKVVFGFYINPSDVTPVIAVKNKFEYVGYFGEDRKLINRDNTSVDDNVECRFCSSLVGDKVGFVYPVMFSRFNETSDLLEQIPDEYTSTDDLSRVISSKFQMSVICESCFNDFLEIRETLFDQHKSLIISFKV